MKTTELAIFDPKNNKTKNTMSRARVFTAFDPQVKKCRSAIQGKSRPKWPGQHPPPLEPSMGKLLGQTAEKSLGNLVPGLTDISKDDDESWCHLVK